MSRHCSLTEQKRGRIEKREIHVCDNLTGIPKTWQGVKSIIKLVRQCRVRGKTSQQVAYFISSLPKETDASIFLQGIRGHWGIESFHYIKDVIFKEDQSKLVKGNAPVNISIVRNIAINILRRKTQKSVVRHIRMIAHQVGRLFKLILE